MFFQQSLRQRCVPGPGRAPVDLAELIARGGTVYLLGRDDPYASASPLMTAVAEDVLDTALSWRTPAGMGGCARRFWRAWTSCRPPRRCRRCALGWPTNARSGCRSSTPRKPGGSSVICYGEDEARALFGLTNIISPLRWRQGRRVQPGDIRADRHHPRHPHHPHPRHGRHGTGTSHIGADERSAPKRFRSARTARPDRGGERRTVDRAARLAPRRQTRPGPAGSPGNAKASSTLPAPGTPPDAHPGRRRRGHPPEPDTTTAWGSSPTVRPTVTRG